ncbi:major histocompatibility complex class I-related gene protein-like isoform X4 [Oncorhynchus keta]|uniref:major histocompatibility complex class I-related gene protein-like isoform X4 n=1 Tax=Oncorhynchus keta TaxID=8018 RepID=UPI0015F7B95B|nr:major histocompatibility complex class I-related gene protein-like isoform X4 [Oncorhynchus keta]
MITTILISFMQFSIIAPHSLHRHCIATQGTLYPKNIQLVMIDDVIVYYYNSSAEQEAVVPEWLNHPEGIEFWQEVHRNLKFNRYVMDTAVRVTSEHYNHSHDHFYQAHGRCGWKSDGTTEAFMSHAYDGKDFVSFDVSTRTWTAAVSHAVFYKRKRETDLEDLVRLVIHYESGCIRWLEKLLEFSVTVREPKVPAVSLFERPPHGNSEVEVTCHVTGFYPRAVQVEWLGAEGHPMVDGVNSGEVLPNGDGSYQLRKSLTVPQEAQDTQSYSCLVLHSSIAGNITVTWVPKKNLANVLMAIVIIVSVVLILTVLFKYLVWRRAVAQNPEYCRVQDNLTASKGRWTGAIYRQILGVIYLLSGGVPAPDLQLLVCVPRMGVLFWAGCWPSPPSSWSPWGPCYRSAPGQAVLEHFLHLCRLDHDLRLTRE